MKYIINIIPLFFFFIFYKLYDIFIASISMVITSGFLLLFNRFVLKKKLTKIEIINFFCLTSLCIISLLFHNAIFIKWKVTVIYFILSFVFVINHWWKKKFLIKKFFEKDFKLSENIWSKLNIAWSIFFFICGLINIYVTFFCSEVFWINFKIFGFTSITFIFLLLNGIYIFKKNNLEK
ncbi:inner membrane-spanning protein YciB [Candidatus Tachikawaea gelatinosa]|uniref:Inner membrane-spanning protein YciB n=1 Tax=Candidatus Tachikawaea gelatinosa TaxID=1410383 RepID=A0A090AJY6_9ENTR|nr:probable intracellular septation protein A [Candidatus Tachikawaea gelatinosa]